MTSNRVVRWVASGITVQLVLAGVVVGHRLSSTGETRLHAASSGVSDPVPSLPPLPTALPTAVPTSLPLPSLPPLPSPSLLPLPSLPPLPPLPTVKPPKLTACALRLGEVPAPHPATQISLSAVSAAKQDAMTVSGGVGWLREARPDGYRYISVHLDSGAIAATRWSPDSSGMQVLGSRIWSIVPTTNGTRETDAVVEYDLHDQRVVRRWTESDLTVSDHAGNPDRLVPDEVYATEREIYVLGFGFASSDLILVEVHRSSGALAWSKVVGIAADGDILEPGRQLVADARNVYVATDHDAGGGLTTTHAVTRLAPTGAVLARQTLRPDNPDHSGANLELGPSAVYVAVYHPPTRDLSVTLTSLDRSSLRKRGSVDLTGYRGDQATDEALWTFVTRYDPTCGGDRSLFGVRKHDPVTLRPVGPTMMFPAVYDISLAITTGEVWVSEHNHAEVPVRLTAYRLR